MGRWDGSGTGWSGLFYSVVKCCLTQLSGILNLVFVGLGLWLVLCLLFICLCLANFFIVPDNLF